jgi:hypothetical protein
MEFKILGFPTEISEVIIPPTDAELLLSPTFSLADADDFYKHATPFQRKLFDNIPLRNKHAYITVIAQMQLLTPNSRSVPNQVVNGEKDEWHRDGNSNITAKADNTHLYLTDCSALTEFNTEEKVLQLDDNLSYVDFCKMLNEKDLGLKPRKAPPNRIVTFGNHLHRTVKPANTEFRYMFRVCESDVREPFPIERALNKATIVSNRNKDVRNGYQNVIREPNKIILSTI